MGYNAIDILYKAINIEERRKIIIKSIECENKSNPVILLMSKVLCQQIDKRINHYKKLKDQIKDSDLEEIDVSIYDRISFLINEFNNKVYSPQVNNVQDYLKFSIELAKDKYSLFIDIQGRLFNNNKDTNTKTYEVLSDIINTISKQIEVTEKTLI